MKRLLNQTIGNLLFIVACGLALLAVPLNRTAQLLVFVSRYLARHFSPPISENKRSGLKS